MTIGTESVAIKNSSNLTGASYNPKTQDLFVHFQNGTGGKYEKVTRAKWTAFKKIIADPKQSAGSFLAVEIKPKYKWVKIEAEAAEE